MPVAEQLAESLTLIADSTIDPAIQNKIKLHLFDTLGAIAAGLALDETERLADVTADLSTVPSGGANPMFGGLPLGPTVLQLCAAARATEVDDIHLAACITPSAIVIPTALATARHLPQSQPELFLKACLMGYEVMIRFGLAINGPGILYRGIWPTYLCAGFGGAATAGLLLGLTRQQMAHALAIAAAMAAGANARSDSPTAKWFMAGAAAQNGVLAALSAKRGFHGDLGLLDERWGKLFGLTLDAAALTQSDGGHRHARDIAMKSWCGARQTMSALTGFIRLLEETSLKPDTLREILVEVPAAYIQMIDRPGLPASRQESFANLRYLFGLAALAPDGLYDVRREALHSDARFASLAGIIRIAHGPDLDAHYPKHWPARVSITDAAGTIHARETIHAPGDAELPLSWQDVGDKFRRVTGWPRDAVARISAACQTLSAAGDMRDFLAVIERTMGGAEHAGAGHTSAAHTAVP